MLRFFRTSSRVRLQAAAILAATAVTVFLSKQEALSGRAEFYLQDLLMKKTAPSADQDLVLLALDDKSISLNASAGLEPEEIAGSKALQLMSQGYPWSREVYALAADKLLKAGARVVIFDMVFPSTRTGDAELAQTIAQSDGRVVIADNFDQNETQGLASWVIIPPTAVLLQAAGRAVGYANLDVPKDGIIRSFKPYATTGSMFGRNSWDGEVPSPALSTAAALRLKFAPPVPEDPNSFRFRYARPTTVPQVSLHEIFLPAVWDNYLKGGAFFRDKIVLVGATAVMLHDSLDTPLGPMPGPKIHLNILSTMRQGTWLHSFSPPIAWLSVILTALAVFGLAVQKKSSAYFVWACLALMLAWVGIFVAGYLLAGWFLPLAHPLTVAFLGGFAALATDVSHERKERGRLRFTLERYVSKDVVKEIVDNPSSYLNDLGGQRKECAVVLFCDLKGFTSKAETMDASAMVLKLNEYFTEMVDVVFAHRGTLDKFIGDALMATWGCMGADDARQNAKDAVDTALEMKRRLAAFNARRAPDDSLWEAGIALAQGPVIFGNIGSQQKMDPTVIGDTVNLAARLEGLTRMYGCDLILSSAMAAAVDHPLLLIDIVRVKGRQTPEALHYPVEAAERGWVERFDAARVLYVRGDFQPALHAFRELAADPFLPILAECYRRRCEAFLLDPPKGNWDGVWTFTEK